MLSNCVPTLLANPFGLDAAALAEAIAASRDAGFEAIGLWGFHVQFGGDDAARAVADGGLPVATIDAALSWVDGPSDAALGEIEATTGSILARTVLHIRGALGAHITVRTEEPVAAATTVLRTHAPTPGTRVTDGIAHFAHLGGALFGFLLFMYWRKTGEQLY